MTKISEILQQLMPSAIDVPIVQVLGTSNREFQPLNTALEDFPLSPAQVLVCYLPVSWLACATPRSRALRDKLLAVENNWLDLAVALPSGAIENTSAFFALLVLIKNRKKDTIRFVDARGEKMVEAKSDYREILLRKLPLAPSYYCQDSAVSEIEKIRRGGRPLSDVADILIAPKSSDSGTEYPCLSVREFADFGYTNPSDCSTKLYQTVDDGLTLRQNDIVFVLQGAATRIAIVWPNVRHCVPSYMTCILRSREVDPRALYMYLKSEVVESYISLCVSGNALSRLPVATLKNLPVPIFTAEQEQEMISLFMRLDSLRLQIKAATNIAQSLFKKFFKLP